MNTRYYDENLKPEKPMRPGTEASWWTEGNQIFTTSVGTIEEGLWLDYYKKTGECHVYNFLYENQTNVRFKVDSFEEVKIIRKCLRAANRK
jgi:hypothetical protein